MQAYHVDRVAGLTPGCSVNLIKGILVTGEGELLHAESLFPHGVTRHGRWNLFERKFLNDPTDQETELIFEYVRRAAFPDRPSRYVSVFAWENLEDTERFRSDPDTQAAGAPIWLVEAEVAFRGDMTLLDLEGTAFDVSYRAHRYWSGEASDDPPHWEVLLEPPVQVLEQVEPPRPLTEPS